MFLLRRWGPLLSRNPLDNAYGCKDIERSWTIATDREYDERTGPDRWRVTRQDVYDERSRRTVSRPIRVNGERGLRRWLRRTVT